MMAPETVVTVETGKPQGAPAQSGAGGGALDWVKINVDYYKTVPGILKLAELVLGILCMALASPAFLAGVQFFMFVAISSFIITLLWVFVYLLGVREALTQPINWPLTELINTAIQTLLYFIAFIVQFSSAGWFYNHYKYGAYTAAAVFGLFNTLAYAASTFLVFAEHRNTVAAAA